MVRAMVHSTKHYAQMTFTPVTAASTVVFTVADAVNRVSANTSVEVAEGSTIKAVYCEVWAVHSAVDGFFTAAIAKLPGGVGNILQADLVDLFAYDNKKNILFTSQGLSPQESTQGPLPIYRGWIKIPKSKQRFGLGDRFQFALSNRGTDTTNMCGIFIYKEYS